jgi:hypothetical protein
MLGVWEMSNALPFFPSPGIRSAGGAKTGGLESESPVELEYTRSAMILPPLRYVSISWILL